MKSAVVIPARMASSRFPGKPLAPIHGKPMIQWVYEAVAGAKVDTVVIATCDEAIRSAAHAFGARAIMTADTHERASDRVAEAIRDIDADVVIMVQGDEPMIATSAVDRTLDAFAADAAIACTNLVSPITDAADLADPNTIKVILGPKDDALYLSRAPIPFTVKPIDARLSWRQVCVIGFRRDMLEQYASLPPTEAERRESIDMLRFLEHGIPVRMLRTDDESYPVDTPADLARVERLLAERGVAR